MKYVRISLVTQFILAIYFQAINWFSLGSWNDEAGFIPLVSAASSGTLEWSDVGMLCAFLLPVLLFALAWWREWSWLMWVGVAGYACWFYLQVQTWWVPYLFGASDQWKSTYQRVFARTTRVLPSFGDHLAPDAMHLIIQLLLIVILVSTIIGLVRLQRGRKSARLQQSE